MRITLYFITWNDAFYLPFIKNHYGKFCERIVMYDNHSDDNSYALSKQLGFEYRTFGFKGRLDDQDYLNVKNSCWKEERGKSDYVIVCDSDEFIVPSEIFTPASNESVYFPTVQGFNMISETLPQESIFEIKTGSIDENYSKQAIFSPNIEEISFVHGCHKCNPKGHFVRKGHAQLFHFRQIGGVQRLIDRHAAYRPRLSKFNLKYNMGHHYGRPEWTNEQIESFNQGKVNEWSMLKEKAHNVVAGLSSASGYTELNLKHSI